MSGEHFSPMRLRRQIRAEVGQLVLSVLLSPRPARRTDNADDFCERKSNRLQERMGRAQGRAERSTAATEQATGADAKRRSFAKQTPPRER